MPNRTRPCTHRWVLGESEPRGIPSVCRRCGAQRTFSTGLEPPDEDGAGPHVVADEFDQSAGELAAELASARGLALV